jgi:hypothetical protein
VAVVVGAAGARALITYTMENMEDMESAHRFAASAGASALMRSSLEVGMRCREGHGQPRRPLHAVHDLHGGFSVARAA